VLVVVVFLAKIATLIAGALSGWLCYFRKPGHTAVLHLIIRLMLLGGRAHWCEQLARSCYAEALWLGSNLWVLDRKFNTYPIEPPHHPGYFCWQTSAIVLRLLNPGYFDPVAFIADDQIWQRGQPQPDFVVHGNMTFSSLTPDSTKSRLVLPLWYRLTRVVLDKGPLNGCVCRSVGLLLSAGVCSKYRSGLPAASVVTRKKSARSRS